MEETTIKANENELLEILKDIQANETKEMKYAKKQSRFAMIVSLACLVIVILMGIAFLSVLPKVVTLLDGVQGIVTEANGIVSDSQEIMTDLNKVTKELAAADIDGLFEKVDALVTDSQKSVNTAMDNLNSIDFEGLNTAISDLQSVIEPLAKMFGRR